MLTTITALLIAATLVQSDRPVATYGDNFKFDVPKADPAKPGFKVQVLMEALTGPWVDMPNLPAPSVLSDTLADHVTYQVPVARELPQGEHVIYLRACHTPAGTTTSTCSVAASSRFLLIDVAIGTPANLRFGQRSGGQP